MANIVIFKPNQIPQYLESVNTGEYVVDPSVPKDQVVAKPGIIINPDISAVQNVDKKYWKRGTGKKVIEMTPTEKAQVDLAEKTARIAEINKYNFEGGRLAEGLVDAGLITKTQIVNFIKGKEGL